MLTHGGEAAGEFLGGFLRSVCVMLSGCAFATRHDVESTSLIIRSFDRSPGRRRFSTTVSVYLDFARAQRGMVPGVRDIVPV